MLYSVTRLLHYNTTETISILQDKLDEHRKKLVQLQYFIDEAFSYLFISMLFPVIPCHSVVIFPYIVWYRFGLRAGWGVITPSQRVLDVRY